MPGQELHDEHDHKVIEEEHERHTGERHEEHVVREEVLGAEKGAEVHEVVRESLPAESIRDREEFLRTHEDNWLFTVRVLKFVGIWVGVMLTVMEALLAFRLFFGLAGANPAAGFVSFVNGSTSWMVAPFQGIGPNQFLGGSSVFEPATLAAIFVYPVLAILVIVLLRAVAASPRPDYTYTRRASRRRTF